MALDVGCSTGLTCRGPRMLMTGLLLSCQTQTATDRAGRRSRRRRRRRNGFINPNHLLFKDILKPNLRLSL